MEVQSNQTGQVVSGLRGVAAIASRLGANRFMQRYKSIQSDTRASSIACNVAQCVERRRASSLARPRATRELSAQCTLINNEHYLVMSIICNTLPDRDKCFPVSSEFQNCYTPQGTLHVPPLIDVPTNYQAHRERTNFAACVCPHIFAIKSLHI